MLIGQAGSRDLRPPAIDGVGAGAALLSTPAAVIAEAGTEPWRLLAPYELKKVHAFKSPTARAGYIAAHLLVRRAAARVTGRASNALTLCQVCAQCGGPHGQPRLAELPGLHVSLSHCDTAVAAVAGPDCNAIDVESWDSPHLDATLYDRVFSAAERACLGHLGSMPASKAEADAQRIAALRLWVRKECLVKLGRSTLDSLADTEVLPLDTASSAGFAISTVAFDDLDITDWIDPVTRTVGAFASRRGSRMFLYRG